MTKKQDKQVDKQVRCEARANSMCWHECSHRGKHKAGSVGMEPCRERYCEYLMREVQCVEVVG